MSDGGGGHGSSSRGFGLCNVGKYLHFLGDCNLFWGGRERCDAKRVVRRAELFAGQDAEDQTVEWAAGDEDE